MFLLRWFWVFLGVIGFSEVDEGRGFWGMIVEIDCFGESEGWRVCLNTFV